MSDPRALYQGPLLDHGRSPRNTGALDGPTHRARLSNPLCGDRVTVELVLDDDARITRVTATVRGCAIATGAASMMTEWVQGASLDEIVRLREAVTRAVDAAGPAEIPPPLHTLTPLRAVPARERCATLAWDALLTALGLSDDGSA